MGVTKPNCPGCALRDKAAAPHADLGDLLMQTTLHEVSPQCRDHERATVPCGQNQPTGRKT
ncbi:hypothetical protein [Streptomyces sp. NPDC059819]|uniref:hypothetical protein n=1 Tax=Streptomyces sp. NPDC059819 TaxID=3346963 RepID=UPI0036485044